MKMKQIHILALLIAERRLQSGTNVTKTGERVTLRRKQLEHLVALGIARHGFPGERGQLTIEYTPKEV